MSEEQPEENNTFNLPSFECLEVSMEGGTMWINLNRPHQKNALNLKMLKELELIIQVVRPQLDIRILVLSGNGGHFCAGGDVKEMANAKREDAKRKEGDVDPIARLNRRFGHVISTLYEVPQTVIVAVEGAAMGGGLGLVCVADIVIATKSAVFKLPETSLGIPPAQIAPFLIERLGMPKTRKLALTGARLSGEEAEKEGLIDICCEDKDAMDEEILQLRRQIIRCAPEASRNTKKLILGIGQRDLEMVLDYGAEMFADATRSKEGMEGIMAFLQRRPPKWVEDI